LEIIEHFKVEIEFTKTKHFSTCPCLPLPDDCN
jgi:hypothetical protein